MGKKRVRILPCGPYEVSGEVPLKEQTIGVNDRGESVEWVEGKTYDLPGEPYHLCRCGHTKSKPFCDGSHVAQDFTGEEVADKTPYAEQAVRYEGPGIDLLDQENLCAVARFCDPGEQVWGYVEDSGDATCEKIAIQQACDCPSGRLTAVKKDGTVIEPELAQDIGVVEDPQKGHHGPLWVRGGIEITGEDGSYEVRNRVTLCRCGESSNMPFCDASHLMCPHMEMGE